MFASALALYLSSLCPTTYLIDSGELATASCTLGVAHPTGYPLYTLMSHLVTRLPGAPILWLNAFSALLSAAAAAVIYLCGAAICRRRLGGLLLAGAFATAPMIWRTSVTNEVYPLTALFAALLWYTAIRMRDSRGWLWLAFCSGLALTNHLMIASLIVPLGIWALLIAWPGWRNIIRGAVLFAIGLTPYAYILVRTIGGAEIAWGNAVNLQRLLWHITGRQYQVWMFSLPLREIAGNAGTGASILAHNLHYILVLFLVPGAVVLARTERKWFLALVAALVLNVGYAVNYAIPDIEAYYIPGFVALLMIAGYSLRAISRHLRWYLVAPALAALAVGNYGSATLRGNTFGADYGRVHLEAVPEGGLLLCTYWDIYSPLMYQRQVLKERADAVVIDKELLRRTWYLGYLERAYPELCHAARPELDAFRVELRKFEYGRPYDPQVIQARFIALLGRFIAQAETTGAFVAMPAPDQDLSALRGRFHFVPRGMVFQLTSDTLRVAPFPDTLRLSRPRCVNDQRLRDNLTLTKRLLDLNARYQEARGGAERAARIRAWARDL